MTGTPLTDEDKSDIVYFWREKGDLTRLCSWERIKPALAREYPEVLKAWEDYRTSIRTLNAVIRNLEDQ